MSTVLGIDLGTQTVKVLFYDPRVSEIVAAASAPLELRQSKAGVAEQEAIWWVDALKVALQQIDRATRESVTAIGVSGQQHGFVALDEDGRVLAPVKLWCDTSTAAECDAIMSAVGGPSACLAETGNLILPGYTASKVRWLKDARPQLYSRLDCILLPHDYLNFYLTGERSMEAGDASGTGFLNVRDRQWSAAMLAAIDPDRDLRECLPDVAVGNRPVGKLVASVAADLGLPSGIHVSIGGGDNMMAAIGTGNVVPGAVTISLGTSGTVYAYSDSPIIDPEGNIAAFCSSTGGWLPLFCTMNCTVTTELMRDLLDTDIEGFESRLASSPPGAGGVITLPFFNGERTPNLPRAKGCVLGLDTRNTCSQNILRSAVEGATFALRSGLEKLQALGVAVDAIVLTGGGANSAAWRQVVADVCNAPVSIPRNTESAAYGAALQALAMLEGEHTPFGEFITSHLAYDPDGCCEPRPSTVDAYNAAYHEYQRAVEQIAVLYS